MNGWVNKTGDRVMGIGVDGRLRPGDIEKYQFIDYVVFLCNHSTIPDSESILHTKMVIK